MQMNDNADSLSPILEREDHREAGDHHSLSRAEIEVFNIKPELRDKLAHAMLRYEGYLDIVVGVGEEFDRQAEWDRMRFPEFAPKTGEDGGVYFNMFEAARFMCRVCGLPYDQCFAWSLKYEMVFWRAGLPVPDDDLPVSPDYKARMNSETNKVQEVRAVAEDGESRIVRADSEDWEA